MGRIGKWAVILTKFNIIYVLYKEIKGQALANFLPILDDSLLITDLPDEEVMVTEGVTPIGKYTSTVLLAY